MNLNWTNWTKSRSKEKTKQSSFSVNKFERSLEVLQISWNRIIENVVKVLKRGIFARE